MGRLQHRSSIFVTVLVAGSQNAHGHVLYQTSNFLNCFSSYLGTVSNVWIFVLVRFRAQF